MKMRRLMRSLVMFIVYIGILPLFGCAHAPYPPVQNLWSRLTKRQYVRGKKPWEFSYFHTIPNAYKKVLLQCKQDGNSLGPKRLAESNAFFSDGTLSDLSVPFQPEREFEKFYDGTPDEVFKERFNALKLTDKYKDYEAKIKRCEQILRSEAFWKGVLGNDFFNALAENCNKQETEPSARLCVRGHSYKLNSYRCREIRVLTNECILDSLFRRVYNVSLSQQHKEAKEDIKRKNIVYAAGVEKQKYATDKEGEDRKETVTDFEIHLKLTVNMDTEEIEEVVLYDRFFVDKPICSFEGGRVIFDKNWEDVDKRESADLGYVAF